MWPPDLCVARLLIALALLACRPGWATTGWAMTEAEMAGSPQERQITAEPPTAAESRPISMLATGRMETLAPEGSGVMPLYLSRDWSRPLPDVRRVVIVTHGQLRNADEYYATAVAARIAAGEAGQDAMLIAPQFLATVDVTAREFPDDFLHWSFAGWKGGAPAIGPAPISSFAVFDAILARLADRRIFPNLRHVVVAGHSAGAQLVQRYAAVGRGGPELAATGISVRYVAANASSYLYMNDWRPVETIRDACPGFDVWRYGLRGAPPYVRLTPELEAAYAARDIVYLLGTADSDPNSPSLAKSCAAEAQGPTRHARGLAYAEMIRSRYRDTANGVMEVPGVGHDGNRMFTSACGLAALFDRPGC